MINRVKAIPLYMSYSDVKQLHGLLVDLINNNDFCSDSTLVLGQKPMSMDLYVSICYDGINEASRVEFE